MLVEENLLQPQPSGGEFLIRVYAAGVTPTELLWYPTSHNKAGERRVHAIPGHEFSGVIATVVEDVTGFVAPPGVSVIHRKSATTARPREDGCCHRRLVEPRQPRQPDGIAATTLPPPLRSKKSRLHR
ncbi:MAG: alcohol dehydrogenase catalytic domain-containing protein [Acidobacteriota bacterium]